MEGGCYELLLHEQLPWASHGGAGSCDCVAFDSNCVASFFISFHQAHMNVPPSVSSLSRCRMRFSFKAAADGHQGGGDGGVPALLSLEVASRTRTSDVDEGCLGFVIEGMGCEGEGRD